MIELAIGWQSDFWVRPEEAKPVCGSNGHCREPDDEEANKSFPCYAFRFGR